MDTMREDIRAEEDGHGRQGDGGVDGHALPHGPPDQAEVGSRAGISSAVDNGLAHQWQVLVHEKNQKQPKTSTACHAAGGNKGVQKQKHLFLHLAERTCSWVPTMEPASTSAATDSTDLTLICL